jgi:hypothetical protein
MNADQRRKAAIALIAVFPLFAQDEGPIGILRGDAVVRRGTTLDGSIVLKTTDEQHEYQCHYDNFSYLERDGERIGAGAIKSGDHLEIVSDHKPGSKDCYARSIHVLLSVLPVNPGYRIRQRRSVTDQIFPRGNVVQAGIIVRLTPELIVLRTRHDGEQTFLLRQDTRYLDSGMAADFSKLETNIHVSVRAGMNLDNKLEVFQIIWGRIDGPK